MKSSSESLFLPFFALPFTFFAGFALLLPLPFFVGALSPESVSSTPDDPASSSLDGSATLRTRLRGGASSEALRARAALPSLAAIASGREEAVEAS